MSERRMPKPTETPKRVWLLWGEEGWISARPPEAYGSPILMFHREDEAKATAARHGLIAAAFDLRPASPSTP